MPDLTDNFQFTRPDFGANPIQFFKEVKTELAKVSWPSRPAVIKLTAVVLGVSAFVAVYLGGLDYVFAKAMEIVLKM